VDSTSPGAQLYEAYWTAVGRARSTGQLRSTAWFVLALQVTFSVLDRWAFPDRFPFFLAMRMSVNLAMVLILLRLRFTQPKLSEMLLCMSVGGEILAMIYATGGPESRYYPGLIILFVGMPVLMPLRAREALIVVATFCSGFALSPLALRRPFSIDEFVVALVFVFSGAVESVLSCTILTQASLRDFVQHRDIERARDELKELDRAKSRFTANIHHELRTPLTLVLSPLEAMLGGEFGEMGEGPRHYLRTMQVNALRLLKLINNLLDVAKAESKELRLHRRATEIGNLLADVAMGARPMAERKGVMLKTEGLDGLPMIHVDPEALEKIVMNLVGNALKFTDPGGSITVSAQGEDGGGVRITVRDTGLGIPPEQLERIFDRFAQVDTSATRRHEGTGIGLSLVKELVELHGGRVWAESEGLGRGACFFVVLPRGEEDGGLEETVLQTETGGGVTLGRSLGALEAELNLSTSSGEAEGSEQYRNVDLERSVTRWEGERAEVASSADAVSDAPEIVVAEDNAEMRRLLAHLLSHEFRVRQARNGREALEAVREHPPDLVLTDVMMPEMSGTELCRVLKASPETRSIPVVLVTSKAEREMKVKGLELGADDYVTKPFHPRELLARVRSLVRLHRLQAQLEERNRALGEANDQLERTLRELKAAEVQLVQSERLAAVGELAAGVAHEVNNPVNFSLNAIRMLKSHLAGLREIATAVASIELDDATQLPMRARELEHLRNELGVQELAQDLAELVEIATEGLERTQRLVGDLKDFAGPLQRAPHEFVDLERCLRSTVQLLGHPLQRAGVRVDMQIEGRLPRVRGDVGALNQVFLNLLKNAGEALETRGGRIGVNARCEGASVVVEICDDGPGVAAEVRSRLFEPFVSTKDAGRGTGLGLSISHRIVTEHGGTLELGSETREGTVFTIRLPAEERDAS